MHVTKTVQQLVHEGAVGDSESELLTRQLDNMNAVCPPSLLSLLFSSLLVSFLLSSALLFSSLLSFILL